MEDSDCARIPTAYFLLGFGWRGRVCTLCILISLAEYLCSLALWVSKHLDNKYSCNTSVFIAFHEPLRRMLRAVAGTGPYKKECIFMYFVLDKTAGSPIHCSLYSNCYRPAGQKRRNRKWLSLSGTSTQRSTYQRASERRSAEQRRINFARSVAVLSMNEI